MSHHMLVKLVSVPVEKVVVRKFKSLKSLLKDLKIDNTSSKYVCISIVIKDPNKKSRIIGYQTDEVETLEIAKTSQDIKKYSNSHVLFLVNPVSGKRNGKKMFKKLEPHLIRLNLNYTYICTNNQRHIHEIDFKSFSKIVFISGDGLIFDYLQMAVEKNLLHTPIAVIKAGTGNALATSLDCLDKDVALLTALYGEPKPMHLTKYDFVNKQFYSFLGLYWGLIADIDLGSEGFRFVGPLRTDLAAIYYMLKHKMYNGNLKYKNEQGEYTTVEINLSCFLAMTLPYLDEEHYGCPFARLADKSIHIVYKNFKLKDGLSLLLNGRDAEKFKRLDMSYIKTNEYELEPLGKASLLDLDGEFVPYGKVSAKVTDLNIGIMAPEWLDLDELTSTTSGINKPAMV